MLCLPASPAQHHRAAFMLLGLMGHLSPYAQASMTLHTSQTPVKRHSRHDWHSVCCWASRPAAPVHAPATCLSSMRESKAGATLSCSLTGRNTSKSTQVTDPGLGPLVLTNKVAACGTHATCQPPGEGGGCSKTQAAEVPRGGVAFQACQVCMMKVKNPHYTSHTCGAPQSIRQTSLPPAEKWLKPGVGVPVSASTLLLPR